MVRCGSKQAAEVLRLTYNHTNMHYVHLEPDSDIARKYEWKEHSPQ
jgi:hypothetical protein